MILPDFVIGVTERMSCCSPFGFVDVGSNNYQGFDTSEIPLSGCHSEYRSTIAGSSRNNSKNKIKKTSKLENPEDRKTKIE